MGTLLVNERMIESYLYARDKFLKPGGEFPIIGKACAPVRRLCGGVSPPPAHAAQGRRSPAAALHARAGKMFPRLGRVHVCAFSDESLLSEVGLAGLAGLRTAAWG